MAEEQLFAFDLDGSGTIDRFEFVARMLVLRGDARVSHIYLAEFMRLFDHHRRRNEAFGDASRMDRRLGGDWAAAHFRPGSRGAAERRLFLGGVADVNGRPDDGAC